MHFLKIFISRFKKCERATTAIEFALVLPAILLFVFGILEYTMVFLAENVLENAVNAASREGKTGYVTAGVSQQQTIMTAVTTRTAGFLDPSLLTFSAVAYKAFNQLSTPAVGTPGYGGAGDIVVFTISYPWQMMTPLLANILPNNGQITLASRMVVKNEPYNTN